MSAVLKSWERSVNRRYYDKESDAKLCPHFSLAVCTLFDYLFAFSSINPEAWRWYWEVVGRKRCTVVDTYWQTETGAIIVLMFGTACCLM